MNIGKLGSVATPPKEPEKGDALDLLSVLGDPKRSAEAKKYLMDVRGALAENERVSEKASRTLADAEQRLSQAERAEADVSARRAAMEDETETATSRHRLERDELSRERGSLEDLALRLTTQSEDLQRREDAIARAFAAYGDN